MQRAALNDRYLSDGLFQGPSSLVHPSTSLPHPAGAGASGGANRYKFPAHSTAPSVHGACAVHRSGASSQNVQQVFGHHPIWPAAGHSGVHQLAPLHHPYPFVHRVVDVPNVPMSHINPHHTGFMVSTEITLSWMLCKFRDNCYTYLYTDDGVIPPVGFYQLKNRNPPAE